MSRNTREQADLQVHPELRQMADHARRAVAAALDAQARWREEDLPVL